MLHGLQPTCTAQTHESSALVGEHPIDSYGKYNMSRLAHVIKRIDSSFELCNVGRKHKAACISNQSRIIGR